MRPTSHIRVRAGSGGGGAGRAWAARRRATWASRSSCEPRWVKGVARWGEPVRERPVERPNSALRPCLGGQGSHRERHRLADTHARCGPTHTQTHSCRRANLGPRRAEGGHGPSHRAAGFVLSMGCVGVGGGDRRARWRWPRWPRRAGGCWTPSYPSPRCASPPPPVPPFASGPRRLPTAPPQRRRQRSARAGPPRRCSSSAGRGSGSMRVSTSATALGTRSVSQPQPLVCTQSIFFGNGASQPPGPLWITALRGELGDEVTCVAAHRYIAHCSLSSPFWHRPAGVLALQEK